MLKHHLSPLSFCFRLVPLVLTLGSGSHGYTQVFIFERIGMLNRWAFVLRCIAPCRYALLHMESNKNQRGCLPAPTTDCASVGQQWWAIYEGMLVPKAQSILSLDTPTGSHWRHF